MVAARTKQKHDYKIQDAEDGDHDGDHDAGSPTEDEEQARVHISSALNDDVVGDKDIADQGQVFDPIQTVPRPANAFPPGFEVFFLYGPPSVTVLGLSMAKSLCASSESMSAGSDEFVSDATGGRKKQSA